MVFITAGMGGTGTGAGPVVAEVAKELGILTVGVVTKPFSFEGNKRMKMAEDGISELAKHVHSLIVVLNENLYELMDEDATQEDCFRSADDILHNACAGIAEIINVEGNVNVDFEDVKTIMGEQGQAMMGTASASGADRARVAAEQAIACPLLEGVDLNGARGVLVNITASRTLKMRETREIMETIRSYASEDATVIFGTAYDESMGENLRVTVVATGLGRAQARPQLVQTTAEALRTGTDNLPLGGMPAAGQGDYRNLDMPSVMRNPRSQASARCVRWKARAWITSTSRPSCASKRIEPGVAWTLHRLNRRLAPRHQSEERPGSSSALSSPARLSPRVGRRRSGPRFCAASKGTVLPVDSDAAVGVEDRTELQYVGYAGNMRVILLASWLKYPLLSCSDSAAFRISSARLASASTPDGG